MPPLKLTHCELSPPFFGRVRARKKTFGKCTFYRARTIFFLSFALSQKINFVSGKMYSSWVNENIELSSYPEVTLDGYGVYTEWNVLLFIF